MAAALAAGLAGAPAVEVALGPATERLGPRRAHGARHRPGRAGRPGPRRDPRRGAGGRRRASGSTGTSPWPAGPAGWRGWAIGEAVTRDVDGARGRAGPQRARRRTGPARGRRDVPSADAAPRLGGRRYGAGHDTRVRFGGGGRSGPTRSSGRATRTRSLDALRAEGPVVWVESDGRAVLGGDPPRRGGGDSRSTRTGSSPATACCWSTACGRSAGTRLAALPRPADPRAPPPAGVAEPHRPPGRGAGGRGCASGPSRCSTASPLPVRPIDAVDEMSRAAPDARDRRPARRGRLGHRRLPPLVRRGDRGRRRVADGRGARRAAAELFAFLQEAVARRRASPTDDLLSVVVTSEIDGERLSELDAVMFGFTLLVAGNETTRNLLSNGLVALAEHPDQRAGARGRGRRGADPWRRRAPPLGAADRRDGPHRGRRRGDRRGGGGGAGAYLALLYPSANRDETVFGPTATQLDVARDPNPHLAFGVGEHFCLGAGLARLEGRVLLGELLARWPGYEVAGPPRAPALDPGARRRAPAGGRSRSLSAGSAHVTAHAESATIPCPNTRSELHSCRSPAPPVGPDSRKLSDPLRRFLRRDRCTTQRSRR